MSTPLKKVVDDQLVASGASGMAADQLDDDDAKYVAAGVKTVLSNLKARRAWENPAPTERNWARGGSAAASPTEAFLRLHGFPWLDDLRKPV